MPFKRVFERNVNRNMQESEQGHAPQKEGEVEEANLKKLHDSKEIELEEEDQEISEKKDRPPRFSTLFAANPPPPPQVVERYIEPKRKGIYLPTPLFIVLAFILFFESTLLFAYTIIGLYNNMPPGVLPFGGTSTALLDGCNCAEKQAAINFSPNFFMGAKQEDTITATMNAAHIPNLASTTTTSKVTSTSSFTTTTSTSTSSTHTSTKPTTTSTKAEPNVAISTKILTTTPSAKTVEATINLTVNPSGSTLPPAPTITSYTTVPATQSTNSKKRASVKAALNSIAHSIAAGKVGGVESKAAPTTFTTLPKKEEPTKAKTTDQTKTSSAGGTEGSSGACFGGSGAVGLVCPGEVPEGSG